MHCLSDNYNCVFTNCLLHCTHITFFTSLVLHSVAPVCLHCGTAEVNGPREFIVMDGLDLHKKQQFNCTIKEQYSAKEYCNGFQYQTMQGN